MSVIDKGSQAGKSMPLLERQGDSSEEHTGEKDENDDDTSKTKKSKSDENALTSWVMRAYHENVFFYTISCLIGLIAYRDVIIVLLAYFGLLGKIGQAVGLYLSKELICKITHGVTVGCNFLILIISIINYE